MAKTKELVELFRAIQDICDFLEMVEEDVSKMNKETALKLIEPLSNKNLDEELSMVLQLQDIISQQLSITTNLSSILKSNLAKISLKEMGSINRDLHQKLIEAQKRREDFLGRLNGESDSNEEIEFF